MQAAFRGGLILRTHVFDSYCAMYWGTTRLDRLEQNIQLYQQSLHAINRSRGLSESGLICAGKPRVTAVVSRPHARKKLSRWCWCSTYSALACLDNLDAELLHPSAPKVTLHISCDSLQHRGLQSNHSNRAARVTDHLSPHVVANRDSEQHSFWSPSSPCSANEQLFQPRPLTWLIRRSLGARRRPQD